MCLACGTSLESLPLLQLKANGLKVSPKPKSEKTGPQPHKAPTVEGCCFTVLSSSVQPCWLPCLSVPLRGSWASCPDPRKRGKPLVTQTYAGKPTPLVSRLCMSPPESSAISLWRIHRTGWHWPERKSTKTLVDVKTLIGKDSGQEELLSF